MRASGAGLARAQNALAAYPDADRIRLLPVASKPLTERMAGWLDTPAGHLPATARDGRRGLVAGYQAVRPLTPAAADWLDILLLWPTLEMVPRGHDPTGWGPSALSQVPRP